MTVDAVGDVAVDKAAVHTVVLVDDAVMVAVHPCQVADEWHRQQFWKCHFSLLFSNTDR